MENWEKAKQLYQEALGKDPAARAAFIEEACASEEELLREVQSLLAYQEHAEHFMEQPAIAGVAGAANSDAAPGSFVGRTLHHYEIVCLLGAGGMGEVYLAKDGRLDRQVALKILPTDATHEPDRMNRFIREARAASAINHPNVATIYDIGESGGVHFIAMEYVQGHTLAETIAEHADIATIVNVAMQVADALEAAHHKGIVHRDIKPANLMITSRGQVKVLDFGIAKRSDSVAQGDAATGITIPGLVMGSVHYMSPEQVLGREIDHRSDIFSLGIVLYEMAAGRLPFEGRTPTETMDRILHADPQAPTEFNPATPPGLERIIRRCLEKQVETRYPSARDLITDLNRVARGESPAGAAAAEVHHNLPVQLTTFIGRNQAIADVQQLLSTTRLLTLTGAGGCGKTRLALEVGAQVRSEYRDGIWLVDLAPLSDPNLVTQTAASVLRLQEGPNRSFIEMLTDFVRHRHLLFLLDNCEHVIGACAQFSEMLLQAGADVRILATSREALGVPGEAVWRVPSLSLPAAGQSLAVEDLLSCEAIRLFSERARSVAPQFRLTDNNAAAAVEICDRLDGIPLAIELAAARLKVLSLDQINGRLKDRFRLLTGGSRTAMARQRTLEATVDWSYELLTVAERRLMCRLSVFAGGWTLEAAEEVCSGDGIEKEETLDLLSHLVDKSLVNVDEDSGGTRRYRFLETVRQYARERLLRSGDSERLRDLHFAFFLNFAHRIEPELQRVNQVFWLNGLQIEHDNLRSALDWGLSASRNNDDGQELASALSWFWTKRAYFSEGRNWLGHALATDRRRSRRLRIRMLVGLLHTMIFCGHWDNVESIDEELLTLACDNDDLWAVAQARFVRAGVAIMHDDLQSDSARAMQLANEALDTAIAAGDLWVQGISFMFLGLCAMFGGDHERATPLYERALERIRPTGDKWLVSIVLNNAAWARVMQRDHAQAKVLAAESLQLNLELCDQRGIAWCFLTFAVAAAVQAQPARAARLWAASDAIMKSVNSRLSPAQLTEQEPYVSRAKQTLGEAAFQAAWVKGNAMSVSQAVQYALEAE
jgi:predicted ATPase/predicted Ser/Thr protein kinase